MPFQVVFYILQNFKAGDINTFSAGEDQFAICDTAIKLVAVATGDIDSHTFEWDGPVTGTPTGVNVTEEDFITDRPSDTVSGGWSGFELYYTNEGPGAILDDKVWRFFVDRGTESEQFDDVAVFATPTSRSFVGIPEPINRSPRASLVNPQHGGDVFCRRPNLELQRGFGQGQLDAIDKRGTNNHIRLFWPPVCWERPLLQYEIQSRNLPSDSWTTVTTVPLTSPNHFFNPTPGLTYRIVANTRELNSTLTSFASNPVWVNPDPDGHQTKQQAVELSTTSNVGNSGGHRDSIITSYTTALVTLATKAAPTDFDVSDSHVSRISNTINAIKVPTFTVLNLDGSVIGG